MVYGIISIILIIILLVFTILDKVRFTLKWTIILKFHQWLAECCWTSNAASSFNAPVIQKRLDWSCRPLNLIYYQEFSVSSVAAQLLIKLEILIMVSLWPNCKWFSLLREDFKNKKVIFITFGGGGGGSQRVPIINFFLCLKMIFKQF